MWAAGPTTMAAAMRPTAMITLAFDRMRTPRDRPESADAVFSAVLAGNFLVDACEAVALVLAVRRGVHRRKVAEIAHEGMRPLQFETRLIRTSRP